MVGVDLVALDVDVGACLVFLVMCVALSCLFGLVCVFASGCVSLAVALVSLL